VSAPALAGRAAVGRVRTKGRRLGARLRGGPVILAYHRVGATGADPQLLSVARERFAEQMSVLVRIGRPVTLRGLVDERDRPSRSIAVTFDDGYADNLHLAKPVLEHHEVPATVFVASGYVGGDRPFWWDELSELLLRPGTLPEELSLSIGVDRRTWHLDGAARYDEERARAFEDWSVQEPNDPTARHAVYRDLAHLLRRHPPAHREATLDEIRACAGSGDPGRRSSALSADEVRDLARGGLIEVGAHTVTHPALGRLPQPAQREEIQASKDSLEQIIEAPVESFSFPFGSWGDYDSTSVHTVRSAGFARACANVPGCVRPRSDVYQLPRLLVRDWDGDEFERRLRTWLR
jgi:peptidoglycan/xylan/chitin deacetylase (PgdA/CDA1 family)